MIVMMHISKRRHGSWFAGFALAAVVASAPAPVRAEGFFDLYFGAAFPQDTHVRTSANDAIVDQMLADRYAGDTEWETSPSVGIRGGYWIDEIYPSFLGMGLDFSYYRAFDDNDFGSLDVIALPITPLLMLRIPIGFSEEYPGGRVQPYAAVGPGFTIAGAHADIDELPDNVSTLNTRLDDFNDASFAVGFDGRAGLAFMLGHHFALFGEYRYTWLQPKFKDKVDSVDNVGPFTTTVEFKPKLSTHHVVAGISFRF